MGVSVWEFDKDLQQWRSEFAREYGFTEFEDWLAESIANDIFGAVIFETWQLYGDKALEQTGSQMETSQLIGVIKYLVRTQPQRWPDHGPVTIYQQPAGIKKATLAILKKKRVVSVAKKLKEDPDGHAFDAELHGYQFFGRGGFPLHFLTRWNR